MQGSQRGGLPPNLQEGQPFSSAQVFNRLDEAHLHWGQQSVLLGLSIQMLISLQKHPHRHTHNNV